jgi:hypothetical protein
LLHRDSDKGGPMPELHIDSQVDAERPRGAIEAHNRIRT